MLTNYITRSKNGKYYVRVYVDSLQDAKSLAFDRENYYGQYHNVVVLRPNTRLNYSDRYCVRCVEYR